MKAEAISNNKSIYLFFFKPSKTHVNQKGKFPGNMVLMDSLANPVKKNKQTKKPKHPQILII